MALVTISGFPCSGKTTRARELKADFEARIASPSYTGQKFDVVLVDDAGSHVTRAAYDSSAAEKPSRAALFTAATRALSPNTITIVDSANYIKGFRYQMYCAAREAHVRVATVRVAAPPDKCREWHAARAEDEQYKEATFDNLIMRYEEPNSMQRWDAPLFTVPWDEALPADDIWAAVTKGEKKPPTGAVVTRGKPPPGTLQTLTNTTTALVQSLLQHLTAAPGANTFPVPSPPAAGKLVLHLPHGRRPTLAELQRLKRQFEAQQIQAQKSNARSAGNWTEPEVASGFVAFLEATWETTT
ncbi:Protein kti12 [Vanrija pseudolonga]|uniref:Protein kti12 n=1 Tax=Vanrija pseudolonga TaxID=143232 RepID=A0AAF1BHJ6_9TREE|nr:Protein kti12 [Vanrija pseudolonga]